MRRASVAVRSMGFRMLDQQIPPLRCGMTTNSRWAMRFSRLVETATGAVFCVIVAFDLAFAHLFGVTAGFVGAGFLFGGGEDPLFGSAESLVGVHAFEEKLGGADGGFRF